MEELKFHLLDDFGIHKSNVKRNLDADYGQKSNGWSVRVRGLLEKPTEEYTLDEIADMIKALSSPHDNEVVGNPGDYTDSHGRPSIEIWQSEHTLERQAALEERLKNFRARIEHTAFEARLKNVRALVEHTELPSVTFHDASPHSVVEGYAGTISLGSPATTQVFHSRPKDC
jgi:hypothetical protein